MVVDMAVDKMAVMEMDKVANMVVDIFWLKFLFHTFWPPKLSSDFNTHKKKL